MFGITPYNRRNPNLMSIFDDFFNESFFSPLLGTENPIRADIRETEKEYVVDAELPGVEKENIKLDLRDDVLTISVEHNQEINDERENYIRKERRVGKFSRSFHVENVKNEAVTAKYNNGVLTVTLPKEEGKVKRHNIEIQ